MESRVCDSIFHLHIVGHGSGLCTGNGPIIKYGLSCTVYHLVDWIFGNVFSRFGADCDCNSTRASQYPVVWVHDSNDGDCRNICQKVYGRYFTNWCSVSRYHGNFSLGECAKDFLYHGFLQLEISSNRIWHVQYHHVFSKCWGLRQGLESNGSAKHLQPRYGQYDRVLRLE